MHQNKEMQYEGGGQGISSQLEKGGNAFHISSNLNVLFES